jgi:hypothetical protein
MSKPSFYPIEAHLELESKAAIFFSNSPKIQNARLFNHLPHNATSHQQFQQQKQFPSF